jgi:hypothetical protein
MEVKRISYLRPPLRQPRELAEGVKFPGKNAGFGAFRQPFGGRGSPNKRVRPKLFMKRLLLLRLRNGQTRRGPCMTVRTSGSKLTSTALNPGIPIVLHVRGPGNAAPSLLKLTEANGWLANDCSSGQFIDPADPSPEI